MATKERARADKDAGAAEQTKATNLPKEDRAFLAERGEGLSDSTKRAKWIHSPDERADRPGQTLATRSHEAIEAWAEERGGRLATVPGTEHGDRAGVPRIVFRDGGDRLEEIPWEGWFRTFDERDLVFLSQDRKAAGSESTFFRLDNPEREDG